MIALCAVMGSLAGAQGPAYAAGNEIRAWGANGFGQLGIGTNVGPEICALGEPCSTNPAAVAGISGVIQLAAGDFHSLALTGSGAVYAWGFNGSGQLGAATPAETTTPIEIPSLSGVSAIAAGHEFSLALLSNGTVMAWGEDNFGQLGNGSHTASSTPTLIAGLSGVVAIAAGANHALALLANGTVMAWGNGTSGQLGNGQSLSSSVPVAVSSITTAASLAAGENHSLARLKSGKVMAWGEDEKGQLGNGRTANSNEPVSVNGLSSASAIAAGGYHSLALLSTGTVVAWGENGQGELGNNTTSNSSTPVPVNNLTGVTSIASGSYHSLAVTAGGAAYAWGFDGFGQLGNGKTETSLVPAAIPGLGSVSGIDGGRDDTLALEPSSPSVNSVTPANGPPAGGTQVTISGANLGEAKGVSFGASAAASFTAVSQNTVTAVSPPGSGTVDVTVSTPRGTTPLSTKDHFTYAVAQPPAVSALSPTSGPAAGATEVKITGTNFGEAAEVRFGTSPASAFKIISATSITATSPAGTGTVDVRVTGPGGTSEAVAADHFSYLTGGPLPTVTKVGPNKGAAAGGATVTIKGTNLAAAMAVTFGGTPAASFKLISATKLQAVSPAGSTGAADIRVTNSAGTSETSTKDLYTYGAPTVTAVSPSHGPSAGGTSVTVTGTGFALGSATAFTFGKVNATGVNCASTTHCTMTTAANAKAETVDVRAKSAGLRSPRKIPADSFSYE